MTRVLLGFAALFLALLLVVRLIYGGGRPYPDLALDRTANTPAAEVAFEYAEPIGGIAVAASGDVFFTVHSASRPHGNKLLRLRDGIAAPFPDGAAQQKQLVSPLGLALDGRGWLWVIDHGNHGRSPARLIAFDADSGETRQEHSFSRDIAPLGSYLQALAVTNDGATVFVADTSVLRKAPALVVHDVATATSRRVLEGAMPVSAQGYSIDAKGQRMTFFGGLFTVMPGIAGVALDEAEQWLYLAATSHDGLYRLAVEMLTDPAVANATLAGAIERFSDKPLSAGIAVGAGENLVVTDVEHGALVRIGADRRLQALAAPADLRWPGAATVTGDGSVWFGDSALQACLFEDADQVADAAPYRIYRIPPRPGQ